MYYFLHILIYNKSDLDLNSFQYFLKNCMCTSNDLESTEEFFSLDTVSNETTTKKKNNGTSTSKKVGTSISDSGEYMILPDTMFKTSDLPECCENECTFDCVQKLQHSDTRIKNIFLKKRQTGIIATRSHHKKEHLGKYAWYYVHFTTRVNSVSFETKLRDFLKCLMLFIQNSPGLLDDVSINYLISVIYDDQNSVEFIRNFTLKYMVPLANSRRFVRWYRGYCKEENRNLGKYASVSRIMRG